MATQTLVTTICDMPHREDQEAKPVRITLAGVGDYDIDLCGQCAEKYVLPVIKNGRRARSVRSTKAR